MKYKLIVAALCVASVAGCRESTQKAFYDFGWYASLAEECEPEGTVEHNVHGNGWAQKMYTKGILGHNSDELTKEEGKDLCKLHRRSKVLRLAELAYLESRTYNMQERVGQTMVVFKDGPSYISPGYQQ
jgi:hypothetical protein